MRFRTAALACLLSAGVTMAGPTVRVGTKATWNSGNGGSCYFDIAGHELARVSNGAPFVGATLEVCGGPFWGLSGRLNLVQFSAFMTGGAAFRLFPMVGLDVLAEPPTGWRMKPYAWVGTRVTSNAGQPETDPPTFQRDSELHWRAGLGAKYNLTRQVELFAETQWFAQDRWWRGVEVLPDGSWFASWTETGAFGLTGAELGVRFQLRESD